MKFKKKYSEEEISELVSWFDAHAKELPSSLRFDKATFIPDFPATVKKYIAIAHAQRKNPFNAGQIYTLFKMRDLSAQALTKE